MRTVKPRAQDLNPVYDPCPIRQTVFLNLPNLDGTSCKRSSLNYTLQLQNPSAGVFQSMIQSSLTSILSLFQSGTQQSQEDLFNEATLMILSRATSEDSNIHKVEVETVKDLVKETTGEEISSRDVRVAANSRLYEEAPLDRYLASASRVLSYDQRLQIMSALVRVVRSDQRVTNREVAFFNNVASAFRITPADVLGLRPHD